MYDPIINRKIHLLSDVMDDIKQLEEDMKQTIDPSLMIQYKDEMKELIEELNEVSARCLFLLETHIEACKEADEPICLDYYRLMSELRKARK